MAGKSENLAAKEVANEDFVKIEMEKMQEIVDEEERKQQKEEGKEAFERLSNAQKYPYVSWIKPAKKPKSMKTEPSIPGTKIPPTFEILELKPIYGPPLPPEPLDYLKEEEEIGPKGPTQSMLSAVFDLTPPIFIQRRTFVESIPRHVPYFPHRNGQNKSFSMANRAQQIPIKTPVSIEKFKYEKWQRMLAESAREKEKDKEPFKYLNVPFPAKTTVPPPPYTAICVKPPKHRNPNRNPEVSEAPLKIPKEEEFENVKLEVDEELPPEKEVPFKYSTIQIPARPTVPPPYLNKKLLYTRVRRKDPKIHKILPKHPETEEEFENVKLEIDEGIPTEEEIPFKYSKIQIPARPTVPPPYSNKRLFNTRFRHKNCGIHKIQPKVTEKEEEFGNVKLEVDEEIPPEEEVPFKYSKIQIPARSTVPPPYLNKRLFNTRFRHKNRGVHKIQPKVPEKSKLLLSENAVEKEAEIEDVKPDLKFLNIDKSGPYTSSAPSKYYSLSSTQDPEIEADCAFLELEKHLKTFLKRLEENEHFMNDSQREYYLRRVMDLATEFRRTPRMALLKK